MPMHRTQSSQHWSPNLFDAAILDLDGTMVDTLGDFVVVLQRMLQELPTPFSSYTVHHHVIEKIVGKGSENLIHTVLRLANPYATDRLVQEVYPTAWERYQHHYLAANGQYATVYGGVKEGLEQFKAWGWKMACVTNKPTAFAKELLKAKGLESYFALILGGDAYAKKKPDPLPLIKACEGLGVTVRKTLMVGDSSNDALAARGAGCPVLLVSYGYNHGLPIQAVDADAFTDSLDSVF
jgi:phosphoglycolate phosphatase